MSAVTPYDSSPHRFWAGALIVVAIVAAYANSISVPFVFDDQPSIIGNPTIRHLWPPWDAFSPPRGQGITVEGRPWVNFTLALNYAIGGPAVASYHATNLAIHALAALTLFGLVRRTLMLPTCGPRWISPATQLGFTSALLWAVHPLQTESVTYIVQRTESLMGFLFLLTLYGFVRGAVCHPIDDKTGRRRTGMWFGLSLAACVLGMATKEVMAAAPLVVLTYDRAFVAGSWREAWRRRRRFHLALASTWVVLALLVLNAGNRGGTIGATAGVTPWQYACCQARAIVHYLRLALWPDRLVFDYGSDFVTFSEIFSYALLVVSGLILTVAALRRCPPLGFLGTWFFIILAPTSSFVGGTRQMLAEHRMYLPLAAVAVLAVIGGYTWLGRRSAIPWAIIALAFVATTMRRNTDYRSELALYTDTVAKRPGNAYAHYNLGKTLAESGRPSEAITQYREAIRLRPELVGAQNNLANALRDTGQAREAIAYYEAALKLKPDYARAHYNLGNVLIQLDRKADALEHFRAAVRLDPLDADAADNLGSVLLDLGQVGEAETVFQQVLRLNPNRVETHCNLGAIYFLQGRITESANHYEQALRVDPSFAPARAGLERIRRATERR